MKKDDKELALHLFDITKKIDEIIDTVNEVLKEK